MAENGSQNSVENQKMSCAAVFERLETGKNEGGQLRETRREKESQRERRKEGSDSNNAICR